MSRRLTAWLGLPAHALHNLWYLSQAVLAVHQNRPSMQYEIGTKNTLREGAQRHIITSMQTPEVIRREWPGFGECRITVVPFEASTHVSLAEKVLAVAPRLLSRTGLGTLSFKVDPAWILQDSYPLTSPVVSQFLRVHRRELAEEWQSLQRANSVPQPRTATPAATPRARKERVPPPVNRVQGEEGTAAKGLPSWFQELTHL
jgi:hypothetical protein